MKPVLKFCPHCRRYFCLSDEQFRRLRGTLILTDLTPCCRRPFTFDLRASPRREAVPAGLGAPPPAEEAGAAPLLDPLIDSPPEPQPALATPEVTDLTDTPPFAPLPEQEPVEVLPLAPSDDGPPTADRAPARVPPRPAASAVGGKRSRPAGKKPVPALWLGLLGAGLGVVALFIGYAVWTRPQGPDLTQDSPGVATRPSEPRAPAGDRAAPPRRNRGGIPLPPGGPAPPPD